MNSNATMDDKTTSGGRGDTGMEHIRFKICKRKYYHLKEHSYKGGRWV